MQILFSCLLGLSGENKTYTKLKKVSSCISFSDDLKENIHKASKEKAKVSLTLWKKERRGHQTFSSKRL